MIKRIEITTTKPELTNLYTAMCQLKWQEADILIEEGTSEEFTPYSSYNADEEIGAMMDWKVINQYALQFYAYVKDE